MRTRIAAGSMLLLCASLFAVPALALPFKTLATFCGTGTLCREGSAPGELVADAAGNLYGAAQEAGAFHGHGLIFELVGGTHFKRLYTFCEHGLHRICPNGALPKSPLTIDNAGNLYGVTNEGGANDAGIAFELVPPAIGGTTWTLTNLHDFCGIGDPACPGGVGVPAAGFAYAGRTSGALYDGTSPLYGVTTGSTDRPGVAGAVYALTPGSPWTTSLVYAFCQQGGNDCTDGAGPMTSPVMDASGNLFGNTQAGGGPVDGGVVYELTPPTSGSWTEVVLHSFCSGGLPACADGSFPQDRVTLGADGNIYGTTAEGGRTCAGAAAPTCGVVYEIVPNGTSSVETVLHRFCAKSDCMDGANPVAGLAIDNASGTLYGTTEGGGNAGSGPGGAGVLFSLQGTTYKVLHRFCSFADCSDGQSPQNAMLFGPNGFLYGPTETTEYRFSPP
jgi:uncharacterized repeat protein (TIGR03803 family)